MFGFLRNAAVIGTMAYFSPVHDQPPQARLEALRAAPATMMGEALRTAPGIALQAAGNMDAASRDALASKLSQMALQRIREPGATNGR
jgi:hypothetical protein